MQAVVLVGGEGTRLRPLTLGTPKPMIPVMNVPFLERTVVRLREAGITDIILPAGYLPEAITSHFGDGSRFDVRMRYVIEETPLGTAGALKNVAHLIHGAFFVLNGDVLTSLDLRAMRSAHEAMGGVGTLHCICVDDPSAFGCVVHDAAGRISAFVEKPPRETAPTNEINAGTYLLEREVLELITTGRPVSIERETFPLLIARANAGVNRPLNAFTTADYWIDLGRPEAYLSAHRDAFAGRMPLGLQPGVNGPGTKGVLASTLVPPVFLGNGVRVAPDARIGPNTVLGDDCCVGAGAIIAGSLLWDGVIVDAGAHVEGAIVASRAHIGAGAHIGVGSVIGHDARVAPGATLAENERLPAAT